MASVSFLVDSQLIHPEKGKRVLMGACRHVEARDRAADSEQGPGPWRHSLGGEVVKNWWTRFLTRPRAFLFRGIVNQTGRKAPPLRP